MSVIYQIRTILGFIYITESNSFSITIDRVDYVSKYPKAFLNEIVIKLLYFVQVLRKKPGVYILKIP